MLMKVGQYRDEYFADGSKPCLNTIKKWVDNGEIYGEVIGGRYYVDPDRIVPTNDLVSKVLNNVA